MSFEGPLGLALAGGGAHGAWQAGALKALTEARLEFSKVIGFSAGSLTGAGYALGIQDQLADRWFNVDRDRILRFEPKLRPFALFSGQAVWDAVNYAADERQSRKVFRCELTVVSLRVPQLEYDYARFTPQGSAGWDGPLNAKLVASCAIPGIFPPVTVPNGVGPQRLIDGGVPGKEWMSFSALAGSRSVIAIQMTRPEEMGRFTILPWTRFDQTGREICYRQMAAGIDSLRRLPSPPRVFRLFPSSVIPFSMLAFKSANCGPAFEQGYRDARAFLADPERHLVDAGPAGSDPSLRR